jgi:hypothetical protein
LILKYLQGATRVERSSSKEAADIESLCDGGISGFSHRAVRVAEQVRGEEVDPLTDLFSLGIVFHEAATGRQVFFLSCFGFHTPSDTETRP